MKNKPYKVIVSSLVMGGILGNTIVPTYAFASTLSVQQSQLQLQKASVPEELQHTMKSTETSLLIMMQLYAQMMLKQPKIDLNSISLIDSDVKTSIMEHQHQAKNNATQWNNDILPKLIKMNKSIISYKEVFENEYSKLLDAVNQNNTSTLKDGIHQLYQEMMKNIKENDTLIENLISFRDKISNDVSSFKAASNKVTTILAGMDARIPNLQKDIETQMAIIDQNNKIQIASTGWFVFPIAGWIAGGVMIATAKDKIANAKNIIEEKNIMITKEKNAVTALTVLKVYNESLVESMAQVISNIQKNADQWRAVGAKYENLLRNLKQVDTIDFMFVKTELETSRAIWNQIEQYAERHIKIGGWSTIQGKRYYLNTNDGNVQTGFQTIDGKEYYFGKSEDGTELVEGEMASGWKQIDGKEYYFGKSEDGTELVEGEMAKWFKNIDGKLRYFHNDGSAWPANSWLTNYNQEGHPNTWYILEKGETASGWKQIDGIWYYFDEKSGAKHKGWLQKDGNWYYLQSNGAMAVGKHFIDGILYSFKDDGVMM
ncbi:HBL/NHE enterotoxin family protein [Bacillus cereus]|uniref:HBL/NHE enterotoxin family protein n=1 Tax=Bacillus cereus TaxID=1396 RepID=A0AB34CYG4_BACCE|nr:HBL/NHE enterotoxin family protein [Bacillus cereus]KAB2489954.1 HBL/NHE enterotoxin family protein [Bacillus cereus]